MVSVIVLGLKLSAYTILFTRYKTHFAVVVTVAEKYDWQSASRDKTLLRVPVIARLQLSAAQDLDAET